MTMDDPRIFRPPMARKYPYHKQRQWSKPYMCKEHGAPAPAGLAVRLAISYVPWDEQSPMESNYYWLRRALQEALPGAQILGDADHNLKDSHKVGLRVLRLNDGRELLRMKPGEDVS